MPPPARKPAAALPPSSPPVVRRRPRFQFPLYILMILMTVMGMALAPASYFMRADPNDTRGRAAALIFMLAAPMFLVIVINVAYQIFRRYRRR